jgi:TPR repeat protein
MTTVRCPQCGTENPPDNRFCGNCGKALDEVMDAPTPDVPARAQGSRAAAIDHSEQPTPAPAYTGGIFNLGAPADKPSRNLDYLLEDDEPRSHKGLVIGIIALLLVVGLGYLRWRNGSLPFSNLLKPSPKTTAQTSEPAQPSATDQPSAPAESTTPPANPEPLPPANTPPASSAAAAGTAPPANSAPATSPPSETPATESKPPEQAAPSTAQPADQAPSTVPGGDQAAASPTPTPAAPVEAAPVTPEPKPAKPKPSPKTLPPTPAQDSVAMGERYLYGRGVPQDCTRGLRYVKPAADQANPKAMITMGALYATGHCLSRDLPTAYRYFALALRKDPENGPLKQNAQMVWAQMTEAERQQAIRMTQ